MKLRGKAIGIRSLCFAFILPLLLPQSLKAEEVLSTDFEYCVFQEYVDFQQTAEEAFKIGECFYQIVHSRCGHIVDNEAASKPLTVPSHVSSQIILQYADSWFVLAAKDGHQAAKQQLEQTRRKLAKL